MIELLVVIAILGVLAGGVLVAINPLEQLARGRDAGRKTTIDALGKAVQSYYTVQSAVYPTVDNAWMTTIQTTGELKTTPTNPAGVTQTCAVGSGEQNGYCYSANATEAVVYSRVESTSDKIKANGGTLCATIAWIVWSSAEGKTGLLCSATDPSAGVTGLK